MEGATGQECDNRKLQEEHGGQIPQAQPHGLERGTKSQKGLLPRRELGGIPYTATCTGGYGPPNHRAQSAAGADPDSIALADGDPEFLWSRDATDIGITRDARDGKSIHGDFNDRD